MKLLFLAFVFFAGFATAVYMLGDCTQTADGQNQVACSSAKAQFVQSFNSGMHKCFEVAKTASVQTAKFVKQKIDQHQNEDTTQSQ